MNHKTSAQIKALREGKNISQQELADALQMNQQTISKYELGTISPQIITLIKIANYFGCSIDYLVGRDDIILANGMSMEEKNMMAEFRQLPQNIQQHIKGIITEFVKIGATHYPDNQGDGLNH